MNKCTALIVAASKQREFFLFQIFEAKPSQALAMGNLGLPQSTQNQAEASAEEWAEA